MTIYLCGGMHNGWQDKAKALLSGHEVLDPRSHGLKDERAYTEWDLWAIAKCDVVLAFMDNANPSGFGLNLEIGYAYGIGKPICFVIEDLGYRNKYFGMARSCASRVFDQLEDAVRRINDVAR